MNSKIALKPQANQTPRESNERTEMWQARRNVKWLN
jgi:hypothetical protein